MNDTNKIREVLANEADRMDQEVDVARTYIRTAPPRNPSQVYSIRIPVELLGQLRQFAAANQVATTAMLRQWILERLENETANGERQPVMTGSPAQGVHFGLPIADDRTDAETLRKELHRAIRMRVAA